MAKKPAKRPSAAAKAKVSADLQNFYADAVDEAKEATIGTTGQSLTSHIVSTGVASLDYMLGGGIVYGHWTTSSGAEGSAKSLLTTTIAGSLLRHGVPRVVFIDPEGTQERAWMRAALRDSRDRSYFGKKNAKGEYTLRPRLDYSGTEVIEDAFEYIASILNSLPDKYYVDEEDQWYLVFDSDHPRLAKAREVFGTPDRKKSTRRRYWFAVDDPAPQVAFAMDSYPFMVPRGDDDEGESSKAMASDARAFSKATKLVRGKMKRKQAIFLGVNQLRDNPAGGPYSPKTTEPGGNALKYASANRIDMAARSVPEKWKNIPKESKVMSEPSVEGNGEDRYMFKHMKTRKCKFFRTGEQAWMRVWVSDYKERGRAIDPVFDVAFFLTEAGFAEWGDASVTRKHGHHAIVFPETSPHPFAGETLRWEYFKALVLEDFVENPTKTLLKNAEDVWESSGVPRFPFYQWAFDNMVVRGSTAGFMDDDDEDEDMGDDDAPYESDEHAQSQKEEEAENKASGEDKPSEDVVKE